MCRQKQSSRWWLLVLFLLVLLFTARTISAQEQSVPSGSQLSQQSSLEQATPSKALASIVPLWNQFKPQYLGLAVNLEAYLDQVEAFGISFEQLPQLLTLSIDLYNQSEADREAERKLAALKLIKEQTERQKAERAKNTWRGIAITCAVGAALAVIF